jgi:hypothetical protein
MTDRLACSQASQVQHSPVETFLKIKNNGGKNGRKKETC